MEEDWADILAECHRAINESLDVLMRIEEDIRMEDSMEPVELHHLYDMAEDAAEAGRIRRAETNLAWRHSL